MKKLTAIIIAALVLLTGCGGKTASSTQSQSTEIPTPFTEYATTDEAAAAAGFEFKEPTALPDGYDSTAIMVYNDKSMVQINYKNGDDQITYRVSNTLSPDKLNGDYNTYEYTGTITVNGTEITCMGEEKGDTNVAMWENDGFSYCIMANDDLDDDEVQSLAEATIVNEADTSGAVAFAAYPGEVREPDYDLSVLDDDMQQLYKAAFNYTEEYGFAIGFKPLYDTATEANNYYCIDEGFATYADYIKALRSVFTDEYIADNFEAEQYPRHMDVDGKFATANGGRGSNIFYRGSVLTLDSQTDTEINLTLTATYNESEFTSEDGKYDATQDTTESFPVTLVKTENGWRFSQFALPY